MRVLFDIPGKPFAKQRPRFSRGRAFTPKETVSFENTVRAIAAQHFDAPITGPVSVDIVAMFEVPKSWSKKRRAEALQGGFHTQRPDLDNIEKAIKDGLNRIAYDDDAQVCIATSRKVWGTASNTSVTVEALT